MSDRPEAGNIPHPEIGEGGQFAGQILAEQKYALASVSDKTGLVELARSIERAGYRLISSGGTRRALAAAGIESTPVEQITGNPEAFDGRMKTISFQVESGILYDRANPAHVRQARELGVPRIDVVVCNLYPFQDTVRKAGLTLESAVEQIDVGGPAMIRAAGKNFRHVLVVVDPADYAVVGRMLAEGAVDEGFSRKMAAKAFSMLSAYDEAIGRFLVSGAR